MASAQPCLELRERTTLGVRATGTSMCLLSDVGGTVAARTRWEALRFSRLAELTTWQVHRRHGKTEHVLCGR